ncbi:MAG: SagB/ThcOx family dehydrogenase [Actinomycetia bacterium]|nr:SagB/ThcOx family dehydrogenase [Actinomycetes bacterium]
MSQKNLNRSNFRNKKLLSRTFLVILLALILNVNFISSCKIVDGAGLTSDVPKNEINYLKGEEIMLPEPFTESNYSLEQALAKRRSVRTFSGKEIEIEKISQLLWAAQGITKKDTGFRTAPSAGALYPLDVFIIKKDGIFHYIPQGHKLLKIESKDLRKELYTACLFQGSVSEAVINIIITAVYERTTVKYGERGIRYVDMEAGHACQNILLQAVALDLGAVPIGAFNDSQIQKILNLSKEYIPLYVIPVGYSD